MLLVNSCPVTSAPVPREQSSIHVTSDYNLEAPATSERPLLSRRCLVSLPASSSSVGQQACQTSVALPQLAWRCTPPPERGQCSWLGMPITASSMGGHALP
ncbi:hypothetical protein WJX74_011096 [Apatococcus lobatus]|uniref:Uncharacterized protein n=1 Tax=Apatococcus lobatus TaxID=904363 RepID=A0AAW1Q5K5_9CHLO